MLIRHVGLASHGLRIKRIAVCRCDACNVEFERSFAYASKQDKHFCSRRCINVGRKHTVEHCLARAERQRGAANPFYGRRHSQETIAQDKARSAALWREPCYRAAVIRKLSERFSGSKNPFAGKKHTLDARQRMSATRSQMICDGRLTCGPRGLKGKFNSTKGAGVECYDSFFELLRMRLLEADPTVISWTKRHGIRIQYVWNGAQHAYVPDFWIKRVDGITLEELKGYEDSEKLAAKLSALKAFCLESDIACSFIDAAALEHLVLAQYGRSIAALREEHKRGEP